jgi:hypothetical protein
MKKKDQITKTILGRPSTEKAGEKEKRVRLDTVKDAKKLQKDIRKDSMKH